MSIEELGVLGEFVGAVAVVISLLYLAVQIRAGNGVAQFECHLRNRTFMADYQKIVTNPSSAKMWLAGLRDPGALTVEERFGFYNLMYLFVNAIDLRTHEVSLSGQVYRVADIESVEEVVDTPGFRRWWRRAQHQFNQTTVDQVEEILSASSASH
jgi:hypothetical protein